MRKSIQTQAKDVHVQELISMLQPRICSILAILSSKPFSISYAPIYTLPQRSFAPITAFRNSPHKKSVGPDSLRNETRIKQSVKKAKTASRVPSSTRLLGSPVNLYI